VRAVTTSAVALTLFVGLAPAPRHADDGGAIRLVGTLRTPRAAHTATSLSDGRVLVAGGMASGGGSLSSAELIDPRTGSVGTLPSLHHARSGHTATRLPGGRVLLIGGYDGSYLRSVEVFDPATGTFEDIGELGEGRSGHTATPLADGGILIAGGVGRGWTFLGTAELFDPRTGRSVPAGPLGVPRESHTATLLEDGRVLITGGHRGRREAMEVYATTEIYDPATNRFEAAASMGTARHKHDAVLLSDGRVLVIGGADRTDRRYFQSTEIYDPRTGSFAAGPSMTSSRYKIEGTAVRLPNGDVLVPSGARTAEILDASSHTFRTVDGDFPDAFYFATATAVEGGDVLIIGGYGDGIRSSDGVWRFTDR